MAEKFCFTAEPVFGSMKGNIVIISKALYGLNSSGATWRAHLTQGMIDLDYSPRQADPDILKRPMVKSVGFKYWKYFHINMYDIMIISDKPEKLTVSLSVLTWLSW